MSAQRFLFHLIILGKNKLSSGSFSAHSSSADQQDACSDHKDRANYVEDRGADAAGGRKFCTFTILNLYVGKHVLCRFNFNMIV